MKTKLFFLLAALLLGCTSAFAQSGDSEPLKGDVNGDGVVDIADINAVIEIMKNGGGTGEDTKYYWYIGVDQPTAVNQPSAWRISNQDAGFTVTFDIGEDFTWFAYPSDWTYSAIDSSGDEFSFNAWVKNEIKYSIPGYILLKSPKMAGSDTITVTFQK